MSEHMELKILVVDDTEANVDILVETLENEFDVSVAMDGEGAIEAVEEDPPDLILLDIMMPGMDGYEVCSILKSNAKTKNIPIIFVTAMTDDQDEAKGLELGAVDYVTKPFNPALVKARIRNHLELKIHRDKLEFLVKERTKELALTQEVTIYSLSSLAETRDPETGGHILRTQRYVRSLAEKLVNIDKYGGYLNNTSLELLYMSAPLHDIGKVGVSDSILLKPGKLTHEEFEEMKRHTEYGRDALRVAEEKLGDHSFMRYAREIAYSHHEKWDGSGYPLGLSGDDIPISGRLMAVADVYDALISRRVYKPPFPHSKAVNIIVEGRGTHFDPLMVDAFNEHSEEFRSIAVEFADHQEERDVLSQ